MGIWLWLQYSAVFVLCGRERLQISQSQPRKDPNDLPISQTLAQIYDVASSHTSLPSHAKVVQISCQCCFDLNTVLMKLKTKSVFRLEFHFKSQGTKCLANVNFKSCRKRNSSKKNTNHNNYFTKQVPPTVTNPSQ